MSFNVVLNKVENLITQKVYQPEITHILYSRVNALGMGIIETIGATVGAVALLPLAAAAIIGETLYLPVRAWNAIQYCSKSLRDYAHNNLKSTLCKTSRFFVGALSSFTLGVVYPPSNSSFHKKWIVMEKNIIV